METSGTPSTYLSPLLNADPCRGDRTDVSHVEVEGGASGVPYAKSIVDKRIEPRPRGGIRQRLPNVGEVALNSRDVGLPAAKDYLSAGSGRRLGANRGNKKEQESGEGHRVDGSS